jgi:hypothetical protein
MTRTAFGKRSYGIPASPHVAVFAKHRHPIADEEMGGARLEAELIV